MNLKELERIADDPANIEGSLRREAFTWADSKRFDKTVSESFRERAQVGFNKIWYWAQQEAIRTRAYIPARPESGKKKSQ